MKKIIMFDEEIETLQYFTYRLRDTFEQLGHQVLIYHFEHQGNSLSELFRFVERGNTVMVAFNFHGLTPGDVFLDEAGNWFWDDLGIPCLNIVVDHPFYYHKFLDVVPRGYIHLSIDRCHDAYMKRFFPQILRIPFFPLAGTQLTDLRWLDDLVPEKYGQMAAVFREAKEKLGHGKWEKKWSERGYLPIAERPIDVVFTGNYTKPSKFDKYIERLGPEYEAFYRGMIAELLRHPERTLESVVEEHVRREIPEVTEAELKETMSNMIFIDLYVRHYIRGKAVQVLVDAGLKVAVFGGGWDLLECEHPENLIDGNNAGSALCLQLISLAKMSLNVMPWFKDGAHDRVFNSMLNGAVLLSDESIYLREILEDGDNCILYSLDKIDSFPNRVKVLLADPERMQQMADAGYDSVHLAHTWKQRAEVLSDLIEHALPWT